MHDYNAIMLYPRGQRAARIPDYLTTLHPRAQYARDVLAPGAPRAGIVVEVGADTLRASRTVVLIGEESEDARGFALIPYVTPDSLVIAALIARDCEGGSRRISVHAAETIGESLIPGDDLASELRELDRAADSAGCLITGAWLATIATRAGSSAVALARDTCKPAIRSMIAQELDVRLATLIDEARELDTLTQDDERTLALLMELSDRLAFAREHTQFF